MKPLKIPCLLPETDLLPAYQSPGSSGADLVAGIAAGEPVVLRPGERKSIPTGLRLQIPVGYEAQVRPRSGLALRNGITVLNTPGTIDADYRGEVRVILINLGDTEFTVRRGDRIAQLVFMPVSRAAFEISHDIEHSDRGEGGFGSTGR